MEPDEGVEDEEVRSQPLYGLAQPRPISDGTEPEGGGGDDLDVAVAEHPGHAVETSMDDRGRVVRRIEKDAPAREGAEGRPELPI